MGSYYSTLTYARAHLAEVSSLLWHAGTWGPSQLSISETDLEGWDCANRASRARDLTHLVWGANRAVVFS